MKTQSEWLAEVSNEQQRDRAEEILDWINTSYPTLKFTVKWNQPMFADHGTYIIGLSTAKNHISVSPEEAGIIQFADEIEQAGYTYSRMLFRIKNNQPVDFELLKRIIDFNIEDKKHVTSFWR